MEWLCLTCQVQRAVMTAEAENPPPIKSQTSPSKVSTSVSGLKDASHKTKNTDHLQKTEMQENPLQEIPAKDTPRKQEPKTKLQMDSTQTSVVTPLSAEQTQGIDSVSTKEKNMASTEAATAVVSGLNKALPAKATYDDKDDEMSLDNIKSPPFLGQEEISEKKEEKSKSDKEEPDSFLETSGQPNVLSILTPSPQVCQILGKEEKLKQENNPDDPFPRKTKVHTGPPKPVKQETAKEPNEMEQSCPLCKAELNIGSKESPNYKTCTECITKVCVKCGFSPLANISEVGEYIYIY